MKTVQCDICGRCEPEVNCRYSRKEKLFGWFRFDYDSQGGSNTQIDLCEDCYHDFQEFARSALTKGIQPEKPWR